MLKAPVNLVTILQEKIWQDIPLTRHMGIEVMDYDGHQLRIKASLAQNINHRQTAFGGSISSLATLACWGFLYLKFYELDIRAGIVIQTGNTNYLQPINSDFVAICKIEAEDKLSKFINTLQRKRVARIALTSIIQADEVKAAEFAGEFVAKLRME